MRYFIHEGQVVETRTKHPRVNVTADVFDTKEEAIKAAVKELAEAAEITVEDIEKRKKSVEERQERLLNYKEESERLLKTFHSKGIDHEVQDQA